MAIGGLNGSSMVGALAVGLGFLGGGGVYIIYPSLGLWRTLDESGRISGL